MNFTRQMDTWREVANGATFFGKPVADMEKAEMLAMIGFLLEEAKESSRRRVEGCERQLT